MSTTNLCRTVGSNTGAIKCDGKKGRPVIMAYGGKVFSAADASTEASFRAAFKAAMLLPNGDTNKIYPITENVGLNDQTTAPKTSTLGSYGPEVILISGRGAYEFDLAVGITLEKELRKLNGETVPFFIWDDGKKMWGANDGDGGFVGYDCLVYCTPKPFEDGKDARVTRFKISVISESQFNDDAVYIDAKNFRGSDFKGLNNVVLRIAGYDLASSKFRVMAEIPTSVFNNNLNIFQDYKGSLMGSVTSLWKAFVNNVEVAVDTVSISETAIGATTGASAHSIITQTGSATNDTVEVVIEGNNITLIPITRTVTESTGQLYINKIVQAINDATSINGGFTAQATGATTYQINWPLSAGDGANGITPTVNVTGSVTAAGDASVGGITEVIGVPAAEGFLIDLDVEVSVGDVVEITTVNTSVLQASNIKGIEIIESGLVTISD